MPNISSFERCTNCGACINKCPINALKVVKDELFYRIDISSDCIDCGLCAKVCPENTVTGIGLNPKLAVGGEHTESDIVERSSSGGFFTALAEYVILKQGIVYGAVYDELGRTIIAGSSEDYTLEDIRRSKYTESLMSDSFRPIKKKLDEGKLILFCGTPCQVAGLVCFLGKSYDNLITCDFVCGGLSSHHLYQERIDTLERKFKSKVKLVNFRPKILGWGEHTFDIVFENGKRYDNVARLDPYYWSFLRRKSIRENCYDCSFVGRHFSDFTMADFWQYKKLSNVAENKKGLSLVGINTDKAESILPLLEHFRVLTRVNPDEAFPKERKKCLDPEVMKSRQAFLEICMKEGLNNAVISTGFPTGAKYMIEKIKYWVKKMK